MTTYTDKKTIDALTDGETLFYVEAPNTLYKMFDGVLKIKPITGDKWNKYDASLNWMMSKEFNRYKFIPEVGQWVEATSVESTHKGKVTKIDGSLVYAIWGDSTRATWVNSGGYEFRLLTDEEIHNHEVKTAFQRAGRPSNLYEVGDIVKFYKRYAEVVGQYKKAICADLIQMICIRFACEDTSGNEQMMQREVRADEVTPKCFNTNVIKLENEEGNKW